MYLITVQCSVAGVPQYSTVQCCSCTSLQYNAVLQVYLSTVQCSVTGVPQYSTMQCCRCTSLQYSAVLQVYLSTVRCSVAGVPQYSTVRCRRCTLGNSGVVAPQVSTQVGSWCKTEYWAMYKQTAKKATHCKYS